MHRITTSWTTMTLLRLLLLSDRSHQRRTYKASVEYDLSKQGYSLGHGSLSCPDGHWRNNSIFSEESEEWSKWVSSTSEPTRIRTSLPAHIHVLTALLILEASLYLAVFLLCQWKMPWEFSYHMTSNDISIRPCFLQWIANRAMRLNTC